jgi:hypothetical protein
MDNKEDVNMKGNNYSEPLRMSIHTVQNVITKYKNDTEKVFTKEDIHHLKTFIKLYIDNKVR